MSHPFTDDRCYVNRADERIDPHNPFANPTEEPEYTPDYAEIVPQIETPGCRIPLMPSKSEKHRVRYFYNLACCLAVLDFLAAMCFSILFTEIVKVALRASDLAALDGSLPQNYSQIVSSYFTDSGLAMGINLISFLLANTLIFFIGCRLSHCKPRDFFQDRDLTSSCLLRYIFIGLWIQLLCGWAVTMLSKIFGSADFLFNSPDFSTGNSKTKLLLTVLYGCLVAPVTEELVFRGVVLKNLSRVSQRFGIFVSALLFGLAHENIPQGILAFVLGIFLAYITISHNSIAPAILVHFCVNTTETIFSSLNEIGDGASVQIYAVYSLVILLVGAIAFFSTALSERLPASTPHQSFRTTPILLTSVCFWAFLILHLTYQFLPQLSTVFSRVISKG